MKIKKSKQGKLFLKIAKTKWEKLGKQTGWLINNAAETITHLLPIKAATRNRQGETFSYDVELMEVNNQANAAVYGKYILKIKNTPGNWYFSTLKQRSRPGEPYPKRIAIDSGQGWYCENFDEIMKEADRFILSMHSNNIERAMDQALDQIELTEFDTDEFEA